MFNLALPLIEGEFNFVFIHMNPLIAQGISSAITGAGNYLLQKLTNHDNMRMARQNAGLSDSFQRALTHDTPALIKSGYQDAGFSVASLSAPFSAASSNATVSSTPAVAPQLSPVDTAVAASAAEDIKNKKVERDNLLKEGDILEEEKRSKKVTADAAEREFNNETNLGYIRAMDWMKYYRSLHPDETEGDVVAPMNTYMSDGVYQFNMGYTPTKLRRELVDGLASISSSELKQAVASKQLASNEVLDALVNLPVQQFNQVKEAVKKLLNDNELFKLTKDYLVAERKYGVEIAMQNLKGMNLDYLRDGLEYKLERVLYPLQVSEATSKSNFDWKQILNRMLSGDGNWKDTIRLVTVMLASFLGANQSKVLQLFGSGKRSSLK